MEFDNTFSVPAPIDEVWSAMLDVARVAPCVPGAEVVERVDDDTYKVAIRVRLGPLSMTYRGDLEVVDEDEAARRAVLHATAKEARGQGMADARVALRLEADGERTRGTIHSEVNISGRAAAMGQGVIADVSARLIDTFATNLATMLSGPQAVEAPAPAAAVVPPPTEARERAVPPPPSPERRAAPQPSAPELSALAIAGDVIAGRLRDPRVLAGTLATVAVVSYLVGRRRR